MIRGIAGGVLGVCLFGGALASAQSPYHPLGEPHPFAVGDPFSATSFAPPTNSPLENPPQPAPLVPNPNPNPNPSLGAGQPNPVGPLPNPNAGNSLAESLVNLPNANRAMSLAGGSLADLDADLLSLSYSSVGYLDSPAILRQLRIRYDTAYGANRPNRAEYFYPRGQPTGPGLPRPEQSLDYQDLSILIEQPLAANFSLMAFTPIRWLNPDINSNAAGLSDLQVGFKYGLIQHTDRLVTFQLLTTVPTGQGDRGLGVETVRVQPGLLAAQRIGERGTLTGELQYNVPLGGSDFAGDVLRYGVGLSYGLPQADRPWVMPVLETVGWTVLDGAESSRLPNGMPMIQDAAGATIVNLKAGLRFGTGTAWDAYVGYGRALTGEVWYDEVARFEWRLRF
ncbi:hypothetical protein [Tuwongella immobilis]|uniref:Uncharacterized protein n=1 Tax=Tuwongella immobilis TaxID=692036 RepID=A0A6C2YSE8_9BACT|nr:hypothetical protein [Tuwongella immobilis]VIP04600.1 Uncharacterized protein OS=Planctomyces brasiliensis (strain ATCC 49424 / DSM 5305 / JCM 21570 / NBRC 103401 / IFAM 1448) GN=Plabr_1753 PE=4 SV=1: Phenol_MetA_deg [Tuwongella immobilis]VTS06561.1 Uncharacterized protein OS=Planctomyces brasiliensis (strain ATCC 49424 / DSM 5305 / JCM 21570 / NBRC 103401 / IFAM 1448) GN=Plabr_1753 PE=4 SV=1: Phenol_MetA_deg [Tuwongella immobilis]